MTRVIIKRKRETIMKKHILSLGILAATLLSFNACQKEIAPAEPVKNMVTFHFTAEKPTTKVAVVEGESKASYVWTEEDATNMKLFKVARTTSSDGKVSETLTEVQDITVDVSEKLLTITAEVEEAASYTFRATLAGDYTTGNKPKVKGTQYPVADSYDPAADLLVSEDVTAIDAVDALALDFSRKGVISKMTLKGLEAGEKIKEVKVSSESIIGGYYDLGKIETQGQVKEITLVYEDVEIPDSGELPVYFVIAPNEDVMLTISAQSDKYVYKKVLTKGVNFTSGQFTRFNVNLEGCGTEITDEDYTGDWVISGTANEKFYIASAWAGGNNCPAVEAKFNAKENTILAENIGNFKMHLEKITEGELAGYYTIQDANGKYLYAASNSANQMKGKDELAENDVDAAWSILVVDGVWTVKADKSGNRNIMRFNSGNSIFSCYASGMNDVVFYPYSYMVEDTTPTIVPETTTITIDAAGSSDYILKYTGKNLTDIPTVTSDVAWITVDDVAEDQIDLIIAENTGAERTGTVTMSATGAEDVVITVNQKAVPVANYLFKKVTTVTSGKQYLIVANENGTLKTALPIASDKTYGYLNVETVTANEEGQIGQENLDNVFVFTTEGNGYTIKQSDDRYLYQTGTYNSFNVIANPTSGQVFTVAANDDGTFTITNVAMSKYMQYSITHTSYGSYSSAQSNAVLPMLYELVEEGGDEPTGDLTPVPSQAFTFADLGYANQADVTTIDGTKNCEIVFAKGSSSNAPKYYTSGTAVRAYGGNTITVSAAEGYGLNMIEFTFGASDGSNEITASTGTFTDGKWTGDADEVVFTIGGTSGNRRIASIKIN